MGKNAKSSETKNREHVNFFGFMDVPNVNHSSFFVRKKMFIQRIIRKLSHAQQRQSAILGALEQ